MVPGDFGNVIIHRFEFVDEILDGLDEERFEKVGSRRLLAGDQPAVHLLTLALVVVQFLATRLFFIRFGPLHSLLRLRLACDVFGQADARHLLRQLRKARIKHTGAFAR